MSKIKGIKLTKAKLIISLVLLITMTIALIFADRLEVLVGYAKKLESHQTTISEINEASYYVAYIDVGQGNSTFVELPDGKTVLIDGGDTAYGDTVGEFLEDRNVEIIDYLIATHADSDHIGGLNYVLKNFEVRNIYRPFQISFTEDNEPNHVDDLSELYLKFREANKKSNDNDYSKINKVKTSVYQEFIELIYSETYTDEDIIKSSVVTVFYDGLTISGNNYELNFFAPILRDSTNNLAIYEDNGDDVFDEYENINLELHTDKTLGYATFGYGNSNASASNDNSAIFQLTCFEDKYFFMGDSAYLDSKGNEGYSEYDFIDSLTDEEIELVTNIDVLLLAHHGSKYSTSTKLLNMLLPRFVVVSVDDVNSHGHPHEEVLKRLEKVSSLEKDYLIRTDQNGDIIFANVNDELMYYIERQGIEEKLRISFRLLIVIITLALIMLVMAVKTPKAKESLKIKVSKLGDKNGRNTR